MIEVQYSPPECQLKESPCRDLYISARILDRGASELQAKYSMALTSFIVVLLGAAAYIFSKDTQTLVIAPIEKMVNIVKQLADDPLNKPTVSVEEDLDGSHRALGLSTYEILKLFERKRTAFNAKCGFDKP